MKWLFLALFLIDCLSFCCNVYKGRRSQAAGCLDEAIHFLILYKLFE